MTICFGGCTRNASEFPCRKVFHGFQLLQLLKHHACSSSGYNSADTGMSQNIKDYAKKFNDDIKDIIENAKEDDLKNIQKNINFYKNHPSTEHFLPLFIAYGNAINRRGKSFNSEMLYSNISMESFIFDL